MIPAVMTLAHMVAFFAILSAITGIKFGEGHPREPGVAGYFTNMAHSAFVAACAVGVIWLCAHLMRDGGGGFD